MQQNCNTQPISLYEQFECERQDLRCCHYDDLIDDVIMMSYLADLLLNDAVDPLEIDFQ